MQTLGYGGHTSKMLENRREKAYLWLDVDPIDRRRQRNDWKKEGFGPDILTVKLENFANIDKVAEEAGKFDSYWQIWVCHLCRLTIRTVVLHSRQRDL